MGFFHVKQTRTGECPAGLCPAGHFHLFDLVSLLALVVGYRHHHAHDCTVAAGVGGLVGDRVDAILASPCALGPQEERVVIDDDDVVWRITIPQAVVRFV